MVGDFRTDALHEALNDAAIPLETLVGLLVLALGAKNVTVQSPLDYGRSNREDIRDQISEGGVLTADPTLLHRMQRALPTASAALAFSTLLGDHGGLAAALLDRRATIARLETEWVAAAEADAATGHAGTVHVHDRETWDTATWNRYLTAASKHELDYMPRIRRLLTQIDNIEKLMTLPSGQIARAA